MWRVRTSKRDSKGKRGSKMNVEFLGGRKQTQIDMKREWQDNKWTFLSYLWLEEQKKNNIWWLHYCPGPLLCLIRWSYREDMNGRWAITLWPDLCTCGGYFRSPGKGWETSALMQSFYVLQLLILLSISSYWYRQHLWTFSNTTYRDKRFGKAGCCQ